MISLSFHQSKAEYSARIAATAIFTKLRKLGISEVPLSNLIESTQYGYTASASDNPVGPHFVRITDLKEGGIRWATVPYCECEDMATYRIEKGDLLFARTGATTGKTHLVTELPDVEAVFASYLIRLRPKSTTSVDYLNAFFQSDLYWQQLIDHKSGSAQANVNAKKLSTLSVPVLNENLQQEISRFMKAVRKKSSDPSYPLPPLPPPVSEQVKLVEWIDAVVSRIEETQRLQKQSQAERQALEASWLNSHFSSPDASNWPVRPLGEIAEVQSGVTLGRSLAGETIRLPYLRVANVQDSHLDLSTIKEVEVRPDEADKWRLLEGDLLLTEGGDWDKLGRGTVWRNEIKNCIHQNHIFRVRVTSPEVDPYFLSLQTGSPYGKAYFQAASKQTTNLASINQRQLKAFPVKIPPLTKQRMLLDYSSELRAFLGAVAQIHQQTEKEFNAIMASILKTAFNSHPQGETR